MGGSELPANGRLTRLAGAAALLVPVTLWMSFLVFGTLDRSFRMLAYPESDLGAPGAPYAFAFNAVHFVLTGLLLLVFAAGVRRLAPPLSALTGVLIGVCALAFVASGVLPADKSSASAMGVHQAIGTVLLWTMPFAPATLGFAVAGRPGWHGFAVLSLVIATALALIGIAVLVLPAALQAPVGVYQRAWSLLASTWFLAAGWMMTRGRGVPARRARLEG